MAMDAAITEVRAPLSGRGPKAPVFPTFGPALWGALTATVESAIQS